MDGRNGSRLGTKSKIKVEHDPEADAVYIYLSDQPYARGTDLDDTRRIDYDAEGAPVGVELLNVSLGVKLDGLPQADRIAQILSKRGIRVRA